MNNKDADISSRTRKVYKKRSQASETFHRFLRNKGAVFGIAIIIAIIVVAIFADQISPYSPIKQELTNALQAPNKAHFFGTDEFGRDIFSRIIYGARISMAIGVIAITIAVVAGGGLGAVSGYFGGKVDNIIMRIMDVLLAIPSTLLNISIIAALGPSVPNMMFAVGMSNIPRYCRIMRGSVLTVKDQEFIEASRACGAKDIYIILKHIIPNCLAPMIVQATLSVGNAIIACAGLSFIGIGIAAPTPEWGAMLSSGRDLLRNYSYITAFPGLAIMITVFSLNLMGDGLRDAFDPKLKR